MPKSPRSRGRVQPHERLITFARLVRSREQMSLFEGKVRDYLMAMLSPEVSVTRYGRTWRLARSEILEDRFLASKLGFARVGAAEEVSYDETIHDFVYKVRMSEQGNFSHFVLDLHTHVLAFEERPPDIRRQSFLGALRGIIQQGGHPFEVQALTESRDFWEWARSVVRIVRFKAILRPPNPQWRPRTELIRSLIEPTGADEMDVQAKVDPKGDASLHVEDTVLHEAVEHASAGYARLSAVGIEEGRRRMFRSDQNVQTGSIVVDPDEDSSGVFRKLIRLLKERFQGANAL